MRALITVIISSYEIIELRRGRNDLEGLGRINIQGRWVTKSLPQIAANPILGRKI